MAQESINFSPMLHSGTGSKRADRVRSRGQQPQTTLRGRVTWNKSCRRGIVPVSPATSLGRPVAERPSRSPLQTEGSVMSDQQYYRQQSEFSLHMADVATVAADKARWLKLAQQWRELAEGAETPADGSPKASG
jgi:hypothetical protein